MAITDKDLQKRVTRLASKPRHETVRAELYRLLVDGLEVDLTKVHLEKSLKEVRGRIDALLGHTIIEIKSDLANELNDAEVQLLKYLQNKEGETGKNYIGIATDGALFIVYARKNRGQDKADDVLELMDEYKIDPNNPRGLLIWLESVLVLNDDLLPEAEVIKIELGRESIFYLRTLKEIERLWCDLKDDTEVETKHDIWKRLLNTAYGSRVEEGRLFLQHTYLTIVAKSIATAAFLHKLPSKGEDLLSGEGFKNFGISGVIESDFFDWVLSHTDGDKLVANIARHTQKFQWDGIEIDILKILYENLIDREQRQSLGEYYTPDWLAEKMCREVITDPLNMRIIDPACGSGTFLFHAIRLGLECAKDNKIPPSDALRDLTKNIAGIDVHPVAVIFARVTYLLALLPILSQRKQNISLPVYLGDSLQWNLQKFIGEEDLEIPVLAEKDGQQYLTSESNGNGNGNIMLNFPYDLAEKPFEFDAVIAEMLTSAEAEFPVDSWRNWLTSTELLKPINLSQRGIELLVETYKNLCELQKQRRNHIWGYVARNLSRPVWLAGEGQKADVVIGNPPWVRFNNMGEPIQIRFKEKMQNAGLWVGGKVATSQDLSSYFFVRACELYMRRNGRIAFVLPNAMLDRKPHEKFRNGAYKSRSGDDLRVKFTSAWDLKAIKTKPHLFPVDACVLFAKLVDIGGGGFVSEIISFSGRLPKRDSKISEISSKLVARTLKKPEMSKKQGSAKSFYEEQFKQGAKLFPQVLSFVERINNERLGGTADAPLVKGRPSSRRTWKGNDSPPKNQVEVKFLYPVYLSECIAPYISLQAREAVIAWDGKALMDSKNAYAGGFEKLSRWLQQVEANWVKNKKAKKQSKDMTFNQQIDYYGSLTVQFPLAKNHLVYTTSGNILAASIIRSEAIIESGLYTMELEDLQVGYYLMAIMNSETFNEAIKPWKKGWHFHKSIFNVNIPQFTASSKLHLKLVDAAEIAEKNAMKASQEVEGKRNRVIRNHIREALRKDGIAKQIDDLVATLLNLPKT